MKQTAFPFFQREMRKVGSWSGLIYRRRILHAAQMADGGYSKITAGNRGADGQHHELRS